MGRGLVLDRRRARERAGGVEGWFWIEGKRGRERVGRELVLDRRKLKEKERAGGASRESAGYHVKR